MQAEILTFLYFNWPNIIIILIISLLIWISYKKGLIKKYFWTYIIVLLIFGFSLYLVTLELSYNSGGREYLLSAVSQVLGTAFALVFTITIISAELSSKYSQRMLGRVFTRWTIFYMFIFIVSIIFPLVALVNISDVAVKVSLILCALCLLFLIPYLLTIKERTSPKKLLEELYEKSIENLTKYNELPNELEIIDNIIMSSYSFKDYEIFEIGIEKLGLIGIKPNEISAVPIVSKIFGKIRDIGLSTIDDPRAPIIVVRILIKMGKEVETKLRNSAIFGAIQIYVISGLEFMCYEAMIKKNIMAEHLIDMTLSNIGEFGINAASMKNNSVAISSAIKLKSIGITAKENNMDSKVKSAARNLWLLSAAVAKDLPSEPDRLIQELSTFKSSIADNLNDVGFEEAKINIRYSHPNLEPYLLEVKNRFDRIK